ncbi:hypothetical protein Hanom_Chr03g00217111 [Helianthus anomalus]
MLNYSEGQKGLLGSSLWLGILKCLNLPSCFLIYPSHKNALENLSSTTLFTSCTNTSVSPSSRFRAIIPAV